MFWASASVTRWSSSDCWRSSRNCWSRSERTASHASTRLGSRTASTKTSATFFTGSPAFYIRRTAKESAAQNKREAEDEFGVHGYLRLPQRGRKTVKRRIPAHGV